jgi:hypothetical protein
MLTGHYATALVPYELTRRKWPAPIWLFLLAAQALDVLMIVLVSSGIERFAPSQIMDLSFAGMRTDMFLSHDLVPVGLWALLMGTLAWLVTRQRAAAWWCMGLVLFHEACDLVVGFEHHVWREGSPAVGMQLYTQAPVWGLLTEAAMSAGIVWWFVRQRARHGKPLSRLTTWTLMALLPGGALIGLPLVHRSMHAWLA